MRYNVVLEDQIIFNTKFSITFTYLNVIIVLFVV